MFRDDSVIAEPKELEKVKVEAKVAERLAARRSKYSIQAKRLPRRAGHRSELTELEVSSLKVGRSAAKKPAAEKKAEKEEA